MPTEHTSSTDATIPQELGRLIRLASGRRIVNLCLFSWLAAFAFQITQTFFAGPLLICLTIIGFVGILRLTSNATTAGRYEQILIFASVIPIINLIPMGILSKRAASELKAAGFKMGMFEATKSNVV